MGCDDECQWRLYCVFRAEFLRMKRTESRKYPGRGAAGSRPSSAVQLEDERAPLAKFNSKETSICE